MADEQKGVNINDDGTVNYYGDVTQNFFGSQINPGDRFVKPSDRNITSEQWDCIFSVFKHDEMTTLIGACDVAFRKCWGEPLSVIRPEAQLNTIDEIRQLLSIHDRPKLTRAFVQSAIAAIRQYDRDRDFSSLDEWCKGEEIVNQPLPRGYLLVSLQQKAGNITAVAELHLQGEDPQPLESGNGSGFGFVIEPEDIAEQLAEPLSKWVEQAERQLCQNSAINRQIVIEFFLPWQLLDTRVEEWNVSDELGDLCQLREHRGSIVRSLDRVLNSGLQLRLREGWEILTTHIQQNSIRENCAEIDCACQTPTYPSQLSKKPSVKLPKGLPQDRELRRQLIKDLLKSPIPIALWTHNPTFDYKTTIEAFDTLLTRENLREFANLADEIRNHRQTRPVNPIFDLGMLCDCPHRLPTLPTNQMPLTVPS